MTLRTKVVLLTAVLLASYVAFRTLSSPAIANAPPRPGPIIAFGDSLTYGIGAKEGRKYPDHLSRMLGVPVLGRGVSGQTIAGAMPRLERDVLSENPSIVLVCLGGNDILQMRAAEDSMVQLDRMVGRIIDDGAMVVLIGVEGLPVFSTGYGTGYKELAEERGCVYVPNILKGIIGHDELMTDRIHPNSAGYKMMAEKIAKKVQPYL